MMTQIQMNLLKKLARQPLTCIDIAPEIKSSRTDIGKTTGVKLIQTLTKLGYARDYGDQHGRRVEVRLRIWGITDAGRATLEQQSLAENKLSGGSGQSQLSLTLGQKPPQILTVKRWVRPVTTNQLAELGRERNQVRGRPTKQSTKKTVSLIPPEPETKTNENEIKGRNE